MAASRENCLIKDTVTDFANGKIVVPQEHGAKSIITITFGGNADVRHGRARYAEEWIVQLLDKSKIVLINEHYRLEMDRDTPQKFFRDIFFKTLCDGVTYDLTDIKIQLEENMHGINLVNTKFIPSPFTLVSVLAQIDCFFAYSKIRAKHIHISTHKQRSCLEVLFFMSVVMIFLALSLVNCTAHL